MPEIRVMDRHMAELIAAGEVVERPASAVKELLENALDAGATAVTVEIDGGGVRRMRVTDDGGGVEASQLPLAFERHATSKVYAPDDLARIGTLGFRGEALASVAAVAGVTMLSRPASQELGAICTVRGGERTGFDETGCAAGTTVLVEDLFYNTPARMKFLKKDVAEGNAVAAVVDRIALSHPEVSIRFVRDGKEALLTPGDGRLLSAVHAVCGAAFAKALLPVDYELEGLRVTGYITAPAAAKATRGMQYFFVSGRYVKSRTMLAALEEGYRRTLTQGKFPGCVLNLAMPFDRVDVNVHPAKVEVRFENERAVFDAVYYAVKSALQSGDIQRPEIQFAGVRGQEAGETRDQGSGVRRREGETAASPVAPRTAKYAAPPAPAAKQSAAPSRPNPAGANLLKAPSAAYARSALVSVENPFKKQEARGQKPEETEDTPKISDPPVPAQLTMTGARDEAPPRLGGEAFATYILLEAGDELVIIDQHAAHERLLYEQMKRDRTIPSQLLLAPVSVTLDKESYAALLANTEGMNAAGFDVADFGAGTVLVRAVPAALTGLDAGALVEELAQGFLEQKQRADTAEMDWLFHSIACRAAVKAGQRLSEREMLHLAKEALVENDVRYCPHGRPVAARLTKRQIEKQFGRI